jgi:hypothetical protein
MYQLNLSSVRYLEERDLCSGSDALQLVDVLGVTFFKGLQDFLVRSANLVKIIIKLYINGNLVIGEVR